MGNILIIIQKENFKSSAETQGRKEIITFQHIMQMYKKMNTHFSFCLKNTTYFTIRTRASCLFDFLSSFRRDRRNWGGTGGIEEGGQEGEKSVCEKINKIQSSLFLPTSSSCFSTRTLTKGFRNSLSLLLFKSPPAWCVSTKVCSSFSKKFYK